MSESDLLRIGVECYAGYKGEQTPRVLVLGDRRIGVIDVLDQWLAPEHRYFKVRGDDGDTYIVRQEGSTGEWTLSVFRREPAEKPHIDSPGPAEAGHYRDRR